MILIESCSYCSFFFGIQVGLFLYKRMGEKSSFFKSRPLSLYARIKSKNNGKE
ncbi:hypothetical protein IWX80_000710 [Flavobacterium sp. CAN_S2]